MTSVQRFLLAVLATASSGCALQATSGLNWAGERHPASLVLGGTTESSHRNGATFGARVGMGFDNGLVPKQGLIHVGGDVRAVPGWLVVEPRLELGLGGPIASAYSGVGAYLGGATNVRLRVCGVNDAETAFNVIGTRFDLVLGGRLGAWAPPEGGSARLTVEGGLELGVRVAFTTDIVSGPPGKVQAPKLQASNSVGEP